MKFEKLNKSHKKEIIIGGMIVLGIVSAITLTTSRAKYRLTQSIPIVRGTINYKPYDLKIMAMYKQKEGSTCTEDSCYDEITGEMPESGYAVNEDKTYCLTSNNEQVKGKIKTKSGEHYITGLKKNDKCYIWFDRVDSASNESASEETLVKFKNYKLSVPNFSFAATTDEGIFRESDGMYGGYSYYWRGAATTNHLIFAEYCWRIVRINGDGTIRLIYNGPVQTGNTCKGNGANADSLLPDAQQYNKSFNNASYVGWTYTLNKQRPTNNITGTPSNLKTQIETWFTDSIKGSNLDKVTDGKFCNDRNGWSSSNTLYYAAYTRLETNKKPTLSCPTGDVYTLKVGLITADEALYAGLIYSSSGTATNYLYNGSNVASWTMTPRYYGSSIACMYGISGVGALGSIAMSNYASGKVRPVINIQADVSFNVNSDGTSDKPYIVQ